MVNKRLKPAKLLQLIRTEARRHGLTIEEIPGRGNGSHRISVVRDQQGNEITRFGATGHSRELSWKMLRDIEARLEHLFGEKWMEEK